MKAKINDVTRDITITVDTLQLNLKGNNEKFVELYKLVEEQKERYFIDADISISTNSKFKRRGFKYCFDVYFRENRFAYFHLEPTNAYQNKEIIPFTIDNSRFYQLGWSACLSTVLDVLELSFHSISNLHIAVDGHGINEAFVDLFHDNSLRLTAKPNPRGVVCNSTKRIKPDLGIKIGSNKSNWTISFYRKSKDYKEKPYISNFHQLNGIDVNGTVDRCELRINNSEALKYSIDIFSLENESILVGIFKKYSDEKLSFKVLNKVHYDRNNNKVYDIIQLLRFSDDQLIYELKKSQRYIGAVGKIKAKKTTIKQLFFDCVAEPTKSKIEVIKGFANRYDLKNWLNGKYVSWDFNHNEERLCKIMRAINNERTPFQQLLLFWRTLSWTSGTWLVIVLI